MQTQKLLLALLGIVLFLGVIANGIAVNPPFPMFYANSGQTIPVFISLNTVNGKAYFATISISSQLGLDAYSNITEFPSGGGTTTSNVTVPIGTTVSGNPGLYQLNITVTEYNSSVAPQSILFLYKYTTYVDIIDSENMLYH